MLKTLAAALIAATAFATSALAWDIDAMNRQIDATNVQIEQNCSGTVIGSVDIITAGHCIPKKNVPVKVQKPDGTTVDGFKATFPPFKVTINGKTYMAEMVKMDLKHDVALVAVKDAFFTQVAPLAKSEPKRGEDVWAVGNPQGTLVGSVHKGIVSYVGRTIKDFVDDAIQTDAGIIPGMSGGALYNDKGELIGVCHGFLNGTVLSLYADVKYVNDLLNSIDAA